MPRSNTHRHLGLTWLAQHPQCQRLFRACWLFSTRSPIIKCAVKADVSHLGVLVGDPHSDRIIAVATSVVFEDRSLPQAFWEIEATAIDSGFQGHMYTEPNDILVVRAPSNDDSIPQQVMTAISVGYEVWKSFTGIQLSSVTNRIILASDPPRSPPTCLPGNLIWHRGGMLDAAATRYRNTGEAFLAFILNNHVAGMLGLRHQGGGTLMDQAQTTSLLMDKNSAMQVLQVNKVDCAETYPVDESTDLERTLSSIPSAGRYVFKPAGGAAGIGVFSNSGRGAPLDLIRAHLDALRRKHQLPRRFQIQEFVEGTPHGVTAYFETDGTFEVLEIHQQIINETGKFIGGRWTPALQAKQMEFAHSVCQQLAAINQYSFSGLICLDIIDRRVIEVNPRLTASAPIAHLLRRQEQIGRHLGSGFRIEQIDLNTNVRIPNESIRNGTLRRLIEVIWKERGVLTLPQGLNPFGGSRFVFINDDCDGTVQQTFVQRLGK